MPGGGRGNIVDVAISLNEGAATDTWKAWIRGGYVIESSANLLAAAEKICEHQGKFSDLWCFALEHGRIEQLEY